MKFHFWLCLRRWFATECTFARTGRSPHLSECLSFCVVGSIPGKVCHLGWEEPELRHSFQVQPVCHRQGFESIVLDLWNQSREERSVGLKWCFYLHHTEPHQVLVRFISLRSTSILTGLCAVVFHYSHGSICCDVSLSLGVIFTERVHMELLLRGWSFCSFDVYARMRFIVETKLRSTCSLFECMTNWRGKNRCIEKTESMCTYQHLAK